MNYTSALIRDQKALEHLKQFLMNNKLPSSDLKLDGNTFIGYYEANGKLVASGGLEHYGSTGLLRSLAVDENLRSQSLGKKMVVEIIDYARSENIKDIYLLTETAHTYFLKKGFQDVSREVVPEVIKQTSEFSQMCPSSAVVMRRTL